MVVEDSVHSYLVPGEENTLEKSRKGKLLASWWSGNRVSKRRSLGRKYTLAGHALNAC